MEGKHDAQVKHALRRACRSCLGSVDEPAHFLARQEVDGTLGKGALDAAARVYRCKVLAYRPRIEGAQEVEAQLDACWRIPSSQRFPCLCYVRGCHLIGTLPEERHDALKRDLAKLRAGRANPWTMERVFEFFPRLRERQRNMGNQLSGGEQQMLAIGRALMTNPKLLILDEATEGLAPLIRQEIWSCLERLKIDGQAILVIDKNVGALINLANRHHIVEKGKVVWVGSSQALAADKDLQHRYLGV